MPGEYHRKHRPESRDWANRGPHALPFTTQGEYTDVEREFLRLVLRLKKRVGPFPAWSDVCRELLEAGWQPPPAPGATGAAAGGPDGAACGATGAGGQRGPAPLSPGGPSG